MSARCAKNGIEALHRTLNYSRKHCCSQNWPYLIRELCERKIDRSNQVFALDTTYIPLACCLVYLTAVIDSPRKAVGKRGVSDVRWPDSWNSSAGAQHNLSGRSDLTSRLTAIVAIRATTLFVSRLGRPKPQVISHRFNDHKGHSLFHGLSTFCSKLIRSTS
jgi:hypothetical protein